MDPARPPAQIVDDLFAFLGTVLNSGSSVPFSNGGALTLKYALDAITNTQLKRPERIVLISPRRSDRQYGRFAAHVMQSLLPLFKSADRRNDRKSPRAGDAKMIWLNLKKIIQSDVLVRAGTIKKG